MGNNPQSSQKIELCQQQLAIRFSATPGCLRQAQEGRLGPVGPEFWVSWPHSSQPQAQVLVLLPPSCVTVGEFQLSAAALCHVSDVTNLIRISWQNEVVRSRRS